MQRLPDLKEIREHVKESLRTIRPDIKRNLNPTPYKVSIVPNVLNKNRVVFFKYLLIDEIFEAMPKVLYFINIF